MINLDISEVARRSGFPASTLRYYEKQGLITSDGRHGLRRQYDDGVLNQLALIALGQRAGYSLKEIAYLFRPQGGNLDFSRRELRKQAAKLRAQAAELEKTAGLLDHIAACSEPSHMECTRFQGLLSDCLATRRA